MMTLVAIALILPLVAVRLVLEVVVGLAQAGCDLANLAGTRIAERWIK